MLSPNVPCLRAASIALSKINTETLLDSRYMRSGMTRRVDQSRRVALINHILFYLKSEGLRQDSPGQRPGGL